MKGQIPAIELIATIMILFVAIGIFFPAPAYQNRWSDTLILLKARDIISTADANKVLHEYAFDSSKFITFMSSVIPEKNILYWSELRGGLKSELKIACNCTDSQIADIVQWIGEIKLNNRTIKSTVFHSNLDPISESDALIIWGKKNLDLYKSKLVEYLQNGNGVVQVADLSGVNDFHREVLKLENCDPQLIGGGCGFGPETEDEFLVPNNSTQVTYQAYKFFYNLPFPFSASSEVVSIPVEAGVSECSVSPVKTGLVTFREHSPADPIEFWICGNEVYFDTNAVAGADTIVSPREEFKIENFNFTLSYIDTEKIHLSFKPTFKFTDFLKRGDTKIFVSDGDTSKILLKSGNYHVNGPPIPAVVVNKFGGGVAWSADFSSDGLVNDDEKLLFASLVFSSANKLGQPASPQNLQTGFITNYLNIVNYDMLEIYEFSLGLGFPF